MEEQYLALLRDVLENGRRGTNRTGIGSRSVFGRTLRCSLADDFPLLTTKRVFYRGVVEELLWFLRGETDATILAARGVRIWDGNTSREYLDSRGLERYDVGDAGPIYGFQWRHFGATYRGPRLDQYAGQGVDQLARVIDLIKNDPTSRRIVMSAWNPVDLDAMALPPCHATVQFHVDEGSLSLSVWCRSQDIFLGTPFNIASYALLGRMMAHACGLRPGELIMFLGDVHLYDTHVDVAQQQLDRCPFSPPMLRILREPSTSDDDAVRYMESFCIDDFKLESYDHHSALPAPMAV